MTVAGAVVASVLMAWVSGTLAGAAWTQSWRIVKRGHFRISAWSAILLCVLAILATRAGADGWLAASIATTACALVYLGAQYLRSDIVGVVVGTLSGAIGVGLAVAYHSTVGPLGVAQLIAGGLLLGAVTNGMLLGHWYLNQPGLKTWALARLTGFGLAAVALSLLLGVVDLARLTSAETEGAVLGLPGFGESFGAIFFGIWVALSLFTGAIVYMARRCVNIRSIQSATGLYYVALLTAGVSEFLIRYLSVNAR